MGGEPQGDTSERPPRLQTGLPGALPGQGSTVGEKETTAQVESQLNTTDTRGEGKRRSNTSQRGQTPGDQVVKTSPSKAGGVGSHTPSWSGS